MNKTLTLPIDRATELARREVMQARNVAVANRDWAEMNRLTAILHTFPCKRSDGVYTADAS